MSGEGFIAGCGKGFFRRVSMAGRVVSEMTKGRAWDSYPIMR